MTGKSVKSLLVAVFSLFLGLFSDPVSAQKHGHDLQEKKAQGKKGFDANEVIFGHVLDNYEYHFFSYEGKDGQERHVSISLPVILYSVDRKKFSVFSSAKFHHGHETYDGYKKVGNKILSANPREKFYDLSLTRNVVQMLLAAIVLVWVMISIASRYKKGDGVHSPPKGFQNALEPVITFVRDDIGKPNLGRKFKKYMPYLLTIFFFILINNLFGLIPGSANVTGNIAFTLVLGVISFIAILLSSNRHYWAHIFWPPVPLGVKFIMIPVEILGIFTKPFALIIRLFANMIAGHIIIICLISLIFIFGALNKFVGWGFSPISIGFTVFIYFIEILVAFLQAYIFTNLTAVFIGQAFEGSHADVNGHEDPIII
jgi:F-type H+-transporting ATPase subunit a